MLRKWSALVLLGLALPVLAFGQNTGKLAGTVTDAASGDPLPGATVVLQGTQLGTAADVDGSYFIIGIPVGTYDLQVSFVGFQTVTVQGVEINAGYTREQNFRLQAGVELDEIVVEYERPLIQKDALGVPKIVSAEDITNLPVRGAASVAALQGGVVSTETSNNLFIRGGREQEVNYYVDGVRVVGQLAVPTEAIQEQEMLIGSIPARYGDAMSGVISITTKSGAPKFFGSVEGITSEALDAYGYNNLSATLGGPLFGPRFSFFLSGEFSDRGDAGPRAIGFPQLRGSELDRLRQNPQAVAIINDVTGEVSYVPFPGNVPAGAPSADAIAQINVPDGFHLAAAHPIPVLASSTLTSDSFTRQDERPNNGSQGLVLNGNLAFSPADAIRVRLGGGFEDSDSRGFSYVRSIYSPERFSQNEQVTYRFFGTWTHYLSNSTFYQLQVDYSDDKFWSYHPDFSRDVADVFLYGDIDHPTNAIAARYRSYDSDSDTYVPTYEDGSLPGFRDVQDTFAPPGGDPPGYFKSRNERFSISANATTQIGLHQIEFGGEYEQRTSRLFSFGSPEFLARYDRRDGTPEIGEAQAVNSYDEIGFNVLDDDIWYYGYNFLGTEEVDTQDIDAFATGQNFNIAPFEPIYYAGYIADKIEFRDIVLQLGLRVDVYDANSPVLRDRFALLPIVRAGEVGGVPANIGSDFAVYFNESTGAVVGFRDLDGRFYDQNGLSASALAIRNAGSPQVIKDASGNEIRRITSDVFKDYEPQVTWQPRIGVSFPVTDQALFFAAYDVLAQRPAENVYDTIQQWQQATERSKRNNNPALRPEKTTQYELGFRQRLGERAAIQISGFYKDIKNLISRRIVQNVFPNNYQTYDNVDFGTVKGVEFEFDLRRTRNLQATANYTLSFAQGTGGDSNATAQITWRQETNPFYPRFLTPLDFDQRHTVNLTVDYRLGENEGPRVGGAYLFENFGFNVVASVASGKPYTRRNDDSPLFTSFNGFLEGEINGENQPTTALVNLRVDRRFSLGRANLVAFVWVQNLLNSDNVLGVYSQTGLADDDGYLDTALGQGRVSALTESQSALWAQSFADHYRFAARTPFNYGIPRQTRLGLRLLF